MKRNEIASLVMGVAALALVPGCPPVVVDGNTNTNGNTNENTNGNDNQSTTLSAEIGYTDEGGVSYTVVGDGEVMPLFTSGQGGSHMFAVIRADGFPVDENGAAEITIQQLVTLGADATILHEFNQDVTFTQLDDGSLTTPERIVIFNAPPEDVDGQLIAITFTLTSVSDATITTTLEQTLLMQLQ